MTNKDLVRAQNAYIELWMHACGEHQRSVRVARGRAEMGLMFYIQDHASACAYRDFYRDGSLGIKYGQHQRALYYNMLNCFLKMLFIASNIRLVLILLFLASFAVQRKEGFYMAQLYLKQNALISGNNHMMSHQCQTKFRVQ